MAMSRRAHIGRLTITENGVVIYDGDAGMATVGLTKAFPSLELARDGSSFDYCKPWGRSFQYTITTVASDVEVIV